MENAAKKVKKMKEAKAVAEKEQDKHGMATRGVPRADTTAEVDTAVEIAEEASAIVSARVISSSSPRWWWQRLQEAALQPA